ncbi:hypothetical protein [Pseudoalteromonas sp. T1lg23B]|uniref:hypothetical protein n=1 Tax=Pseudoalteromonas sp. T1lg23B TaxID=2077097 RepID=UPI000CF684EA|nr:hypothetical protein [Pseudoalteromonas sp. T1lg23B]
MKQNKFLIISNGRSGSTWLETMLGQLSDVKVEYEFKWKPPYDPHPLHIRVDSKDFSCKKALESISPTAPIVGSKLVFDPRYHTDEELLELLETIDPEIKVIHLTRSYVEVFSSIMRGKPINILNDDVAVEEASILLKTLKSNSLDDKSESDNSPRTIDHGHCRRLMRNLLKNDLAVEKLRCRVTNFYSLDYSDIEAQFYALTQFIGSNCSQEDAMSVTKKPVTKKLPTKDIGEIVSNIEELQEVLELHDEIKYFALKQP